MFYILMVFLILAFEWKYKNYIEATFDFKKEEFKANKLIRIHQYHNPGAFLNIMQHKKKLLHGISIGFTLVIAIFFFLVIPAPICIVKLFEMHFNHITYLDNFTFALIANLVLSFLSWLMIFATRKLPLYIAVLYPLVHLNLLYIALVSWIRSKQGKGYVWKGRLVS